MHVEGKDHELRQICELAYGSVQCLQGLVSDMETEY